MASTRNKNMTKEYNLEQRINDSICTDRTYVQRNTAYNTALPCAGINIGHMPNHVLSFNATDIESSLYGVGSTNLVKPQKEMTPRIKSLPSVSFFDRLQPMLPEPLVIEKNQRPKYL